MLDSAQLLRWARARARHHAVFTIKVVTLAALPLVASGCIDNRLVAPDGASIELAITPTRIAVGGDTTIFTALVAESDGRTVDDGTEVSFIVSGGELCNLRLPSTNAPESCTGTTNPGAMTVKTTGGIASGVFRSGPIPGTVTLSARSGSITKSTTIELSSLAAPAGSSVTSQFDRDTISVGDTVHLTAFLASPTTGVVANGTRVVFTAPDTAVLRSLALTQDGFVQTKAVGRRSGILKIVIASGVVRDSARVTVR